MAIQALCGSQPRSRPAVSTAAGPKESFLSFCAPHAGADMFPQLTLAYCASREKLRAQNPAALALCRAVPKAVFSLRVLGNSEQLSGGCCGFSGVS